jgi:flagellar basal-body rod modification protein FlgD
MSTTTNSTQGTSGTSASSPGAANAVSANGDVSQMFMTLLVAQIKNQDPLQPTDPSQFVSQLTQLSQLQSLQTLSTQGTSNGSLLSSLQTLALGAQVGSQVTANTGSVVLGSSKVQGDFTLGNAASKVSLVLQSQTGQQQRISLGAQAPGVVPFSIDPAALGLPAGTYSLKVETDSGETPTVEVAGTITSVRISSSQGAVLDVSNLGEIAASAITAFNGRPQATGN